VILLATNTVLYTVACVLFSRGTRLRG
jgi:hypothetical protein